MRNSSVRSLLLCAVGCALLAAWTPVSNAATCPPICSKRPLWGTGPAPDFALCQCDTVIGGVGTGPGSCGCGACYQLVGSRVAGYGIKSDGTCPTGGTNCGDCDLASDSGSGASNSTKTTAPPSTDPSATNTPSPSLTSSTPSSPSGASSSAAGNTSSPLTLAPNGTTPSPTSTRPAPSNNSAATDVGSSSKDGKSGTTPANVNTTTEAPSSTKASSSDGIATWQIALIICSCVLFMAVAMTSITSCYCKARNRMKDNMQNEEERHEYEGYWNPNASGGITERSGHEQLAQSTFNPAMTQGGRSSFTSTHSRPNSTKNMPYSEPTYAVDERIGAGMGPRPGNRQSLGSTADLPGVFQPFPQRDVRPSHEVGSRKNIAIEL